MVAMIKRVVFADYALEKYGDQYDNLNGWERMLITDFRLA